MQEQERLYADVEPRLAAAGLKIVEFSLARRHGEMQVRLTLFALGGTGTDECSTAHRLLVQRIEELFGIEDPWIEVSSPGVERSIRSEREYAIFAGKGLKVLRKEGGEWIKGRIVGVEGGSLLLEGPDGRIDIPLTTVAKARLDPTQEGV